MAQSPQPTQDDQPVFEPLVVTGHASDRLPILGDALEEFGCDHPDVLTHYRTSGPHALGCWASDGLTG